MLSDQDLVTRMMQRDARAFEVLFERYEGMIRRHLVRIVRDDSTARDLIQEVFLRVWTRGEQWNGSGTFKAWLYRIGTNLALNHLRTVRRRREQPLQIRDDWDEGDEDESPVPAWMIDASALGPDAALELTERRKTFRRLVERLPRRPRSSRKCRAGRTSHTDVCRSGQPTTGGWHPDQAGAGSFDVPVRHA